MRVHLPRKLLLAVAAILLTVPLVNASTYEMRWKDRSTATCVVVGRNANRSNAIALTAKHVFRGRKIEDASVVVRGKPYRISQVNLGSADVASFEIQGFDMEGYYPIASEVREGPVYYGGFRDGKHFRRKGFIWNGDIIGDHAIPGESGAGVLQYQDDGWWLVGVVNGYVTSDPTHPTVFTPIREIRECFNQVYCPNGQCPIQVRPAVTQPMLGIGIPVGPPRVIGVAEPATPRYYREGTQPQQQVPAPVNVTQGPPGPAGPQGPPGRGVSKQEVEATVEAWLNANIDNLRQPADPTIASRLSALEFELSHFQQQTPVDNTAQLDSISNRLTALESRKRRVMLVDGSTKQVLDDEEYSPSEPIMLDVRSFRVQNVK